MGSFSPLSGLFAYFTETFTAGVIDSCQGQGVLEDTPLMERQDPLEDFKKFDDSDTIFQEYDAPPGDDSKMGWKRSRPSKWWISLWKAAKDVFCIQIVGGLTLGLLAIVIVGLDFYFLEICYDRERETHWKNRNSLRHKMTADIIEAYVVQMWPFLLIITMFGWPLVKKLNLLIFNMLGAFSDTCYRLYLQVYGLYETFWVHRTLNAIFLIMFLMNSILVGREIANNSETERSKKLKKTIKVSAILAAQFAFGMPLCILFLYCIVQVYVRRENETYRAVIAGALPLLTVIPKVIVRLTAQRIDFIHPGDSHALLSAMYTTTAIVFRVMQAELTSFQLFILLSFAHGAVDLLERLTIVVRDYLWYFIYKKLSRDRHAETVLSVNKFRTPRSMRLMADMSIQMILGESTALMAAVGFIQLYNLIYSTDNSFSTNITEFFKRVSIALSIDFVFSSFSFWLQMSYLNLAVVRVWKKKWRKHMLVGFILTTVTMCFFTTHLFAVAEAKYTTSTNKTLNFDFNCTGPNATF